MNNHSPASAAASALRTLDKVFGRTHSCYEIKALTQKSGTHSETEITIYQQIGSSGVSADRFIKDLANVPKSHRVVLRIHSPGGSVLDGNAIINAIAAHPGGLTTQIDGLAASMAASIAASGRPARMAKNALLMIHNVSTVVDGDAAQMRKSADLVEKIQESLVTGFAARTKQTRAKIIEMMNAETWMTATEAKALGFVDEIIGDSEVAASLNIASFRNGPKGPGAFKNLIRKNDFEKCDKLVCLELWDEFQTLTGLAATAFFNKHQRELKAARIWQHNFNATLPV